MSISNPWSPFVSARPSIGARMIARTAADLRKRSGRLCAAPPLLAMTDPARTPDPFALLACLPPGAGLIYRHFGAPERADVASALARVCRARRVAFFIAADLDLAVAVGAAGLHAPEVCIVDIRRWRARWPRAVITAAAHNPRMLARAAAAGADAILLSPVFATRSRPDAAPIGPLDAMRLGRAAPRPVYALGGVNLRTARLLTGGFAGVAAIDGLLRGPRNSPGARHRD